MYFCRKLKRRRPGDWAVLIRVSSSQEGRIMPLSYFSESARIQEAVVMVFAQNETSFEIIKLQFLSKWKKFESVLLGRRHSFGFFHHKTIFYLNI